MLRPLTARSRSLLPRGCAGLAPRRALAPSTPPPPAAAAAAAAAASDLVYMHGSLRSPPRWDRTASANQFGFSNQLSPSVTGSALRFEEGRLRRVAEFGTTKQWKTLSLDEAMEQYQLSPRDLAGLPYVSRYHVFDTPRLTRFYVVFDVQDRALERWGDAAALRVALADRQAKKQRRVSRLQPPLMLLLRPVRTRKGVVVVGARAVTAAVVGNTVVVLAKLAGWGATGSGALLSEAFHSMADLGNQLMLQP